MPFSLELPSFAAALPIYIYGDFGVRIFFVLSGFLITHLLVKEFSRSGQVDLKKFYLRRFFRLAPVYYVYLLALVVLAMASIYHDQPSSWLGSFFYIRNYLGVGNSATAHLWSLSVELQYYLFWPFLFVFCGLHKSMRSVIALIIVIVLAITVRYLFPNPTLGGSIIERIFALRSIVRYADSIAIGSLASYSYDYFRSNSNLIIFSYFQKSKLVAILVFFIFALSLIIDSWSPLGPFTQTTQAGAIAILIIASLINEPLGSIMSIRALATVGIISSSWYVWHAMFLAYLMGVSNQKSVLFVYHSYFWIPISFLIALISFNLLEKPFIAARSRLR
jgi:peptidoglycan/LPS O-acetylase OafA/YrhL